MQSPQTKNCGLNCWVRIYLPLARKEPSTDVQYLGFYQEAPVNPICLTASVVNHARRNDSANERWCRQFKLTLMQNYEKVGPSPILHLPLTMAASQNVGWGLKPGAIIGSHVSAEL